MSGNEAYVRSSRPTLEVVEFARVRDTETGDEMVLEDTAWMIWHLLGKPRSLEQVLAELARGFDVPIDDMRSDVDSFIHDLVERGYVTRVTEPTA